MIQEALEFLFKKGEEASESAMAIEVADLGGLPYIVHGTKKEPLLQPTFPKLTVMTLAGLVDAVKGKLVDTPSCIAVNSPTGVSALTKPQGAWVQRMSLVLASFDPNDGKFPTGSWMEVDDFLVAMQAKLMPTPDRDKLLRILGNLSGGTTRTSTDDGITQTVQVKAGVTLLGEESIKNPVVLKPYRTFSDLDQPTSPFVVRLKQDKDSAPKVALFEADGGLWKRAAMDLAYKFLTDAALGVPVLR